MLRGVFTRNSNEPAKPKPIHIQGHGLFVAFVEKRQQRRPVEPGDEV